MSVEINECGSKSVQIGESGVLKSANHPDNYENNQNCEWFIEVAENSRVLIEFQSKNQTVYQMMLPMNFADVYPWEKDPCKYDYLEIFDPISHETFKFCNQSISNFVSEGRYLIEAVSEL